MKNYFEAKDLSFSYEDGIYVLNKLNFSVKKNEKILVLASKEKGKTTFLSVVSTFLSNYLGDIYFNGENLKNLKDEEKYFSLLLSKPIFMKNKTILQNFEFFVKTNKLSYNAKEKLQQDIEILGLKCKINDKMNKISQFECKILAIFRSLLKRPNILFLDDQFENLFDNESKIMQNFYSKLTKNQDLTMFFSIGNESLKNNEKCIKSLKFDKIFYIFDGKMTEFANFDNFEEIIFNLNQFEFINYKFRNNGYILKSESDYIFKFEGIEKEFYLNKEFISSLDKLNLENGDYEDIIFLSKFNIDISNLTNKIFNDYLLEKKCYIFSAIGGDNVII